jgi:small subunit ribosomal protein S1
VAQGDTVPVLILEVDAERRRLSLSLKRVDAERRAENEAPIEGTPHLDLSEDVFSDSTAAPVHVEEEESSESRAAGEGEIEREAPSAGEEVDPAAAAEVAPAESAADER